MLCAARYTVLMLTLLAVACLAPPAVAAPNDWAEGLAGKSSGASRDFYNSAAKLRWKNFLGDWRGANGVAQGGSPYAKSVVKDTDTPRFIEWDVTSLVQQWSSGKHQNQGFFLRTLQHGGAIMFCSRQHAVTAQRPQLVITSSGAESRLPAQADTHLDKSTYQSQGAADLLRISGNPTNLLIRFDLPAAAKLKEISKATLRLYTTRQYGNAEIGVFRCQQGHTASPSKPVMGLAANFPRDVNIAASPDVVFATGFEAANWAKEWTQAGKKEAIDTVASDPPRSFAPLSGKALRVNIAKGENSALNTLFKFRQQTGAEPEEVYFRYYLRLASDWNQTIGGGKMPGISGTYGVAGWGGRKVNGRDGWSARGSFGRTIPAGNPLGGLHPISTYAYHADMAGTYGDVWVWDKGYHAFLENNRWYCVEQYLKLNTPGKNDGVLKAWIDGRPAFAKNNIRFRDTAKLKIEQIWMNVYHGGKQPSPYDQHLYIDNVVIARKYIGPQSND